MPYARAPQQLYMTRERVGMLAVLAKADRPLSILDIAERAAAHRDTVYKGVRRFGEQGWVHRIKDRRVPHRYVYLLTKAGRREVAYLFRVRT